MNHLPGGMEYFRAGPTWGINSRFLLGLFWSQNLFVGLNVLSRLLLTLISVFQLRALLVLAKMQRFHFWSLLSMLISLDWML
jgi:hypothetical protein